MRSRGWRRTLGVWRALGIVLPLALLRESAAFEAVPCNATTEDCGLNFFREAYEFFQSAEQEIVIMPFFIQPEIKLFSSKPGGPADTTLKQLIVQAVSRKVHVWLLGWDNAASEKFLPYHQDTVYEHLFKAAGENHHYLHLMLDTSRNFVSSLYYLPHIKSYSFDRKIAFVGGLDFAENRLDSPLHVRPDPRLVRVSQNGDHVTGNEKPWQDAMIKLDGPAAEHVSMVLIERWWTYCKSEGFLRAQATRPLESMTDALWGVEKSFSASLWKNYQCSSLPAPGRLGSLSISIAPGASTIRTYALKVHVPKVQSQGLDQIAADAVPVRSGERQMVRVEGLRALDKALPSSLTISLDGHDYTVGVDQDLMVPLPGGDHLNARWLPNGVGPMPPDVQTCRLVLSGDRDWMGVSGPLTESYDEHVKMIREAKRFIFIENQYFSTDFPSSSYECSNGNVRGAVLYSGATNRVGEVLLDRIKRAGRSNEQFSVAVIMPLGTEPGSFYPNLRGAYCFEQAVEDFWKKEGLKSNWKDYFAFFFLANAVSVPAHLGGPGAAFYGIFTHTKLIVVDDRVALIGSANINDRSLNGDRDAEVGVKVTGGTYPRRLRERILGAHIGDIGLIDTDRFLQSVSAVANANAKALCDSMGVCFPAGTFTRGGVTEHFFGLHGLVNMPGSGVPSDTLRYPESRIVAGGGGADTFHWFMLEGVEAPKLHGLLFPWSREIWGLPKMTQVTQMFSSEFNWRRLDDTREANRSGLDRGAPFFV